MEKPTHKIHTEAHRQKKIPLVMIMLTGFMFFLCVNLVSAQLEFDNTISFDNKIGDYGKYEIKDWFGLLSLVDIELKTNTKLCADNLCKAELPINHYQKGILIEDIRFKDLKTNKYVEIKDYQLLVDGKEYKIGDEIVSGDYDLEIIGELKGFQEVDWQIKTQGQWLNEWAVWSSGLNTNLIAYYAMEEGTGVEINNSVDEDYFHGDFVSDDTIDWTTGIIGGGIDLEYDSNEYVNISSGVLKNKGFPLGNNFTISLWLKAESMADEAGNRFFTQKLPDLIYLQEADAGPTVDASVDGNVVSTNIVEASWEGDWQYVVLRQNGTHISLWINGSIVDSSVGSTNFSVESTFILGANENGVTHFDGVMDELAVWNRALSASEISDLYNSGTGITYSGAGEVIVTLDSPDDDAYTNSNTITFDCSATTTASSLSNISLWTNQTGTWILNQTNSTLSIQNESIFTNNIPDEEFDWTCNAYDIENNLDWGTNRTLTIDTTYPAVTITSPTTTVNYGASGENLTLNWTVSDTNLDSCWYIYNSSNISVTCLDLNYSFEIDSRVSNITFYVNDSAGNVNSSFVEWVYLIWENSQTYVASTVEGAVNNFIINVTYDPSDWDVISGILNYNKTNSPGTKTGTGDSVIFTSSVTAPNVNSAQNITFYWKMGLTNSSGTKYINSTSYYQTVNIINMSLCGYPYVIPFLNFTIYDELNFTEINGTISLTFDYRQEDSSVSNSFSYSDNSEENSRFNFCISPTHETYTIDATIEYDATGYAQRYYNFEGIEFTNTTTEIGLYLLNDSSSTSFRVIVQDENYQPLAGVEVYMQRYKPSTGTWETVEISTTNDDGETINHIYTEDNIYRFKIYDDGNLLHTTTGSIISCPSTPCTVTITLSSDITPVLPDFEDLDSLTSSLTYNEDTYIITYTYADTSGNFTRGRLYVIRKAFGEPGITYTCNTTNAIATAVLTCDLTGEKNGTYIATGFIQRINERMVEREVFIRIMDIVSVIGLDGVLWSMFLLIGILMMGVYRPSLGIIFGVVGVVLLSLLQLIQITLTAIVAIVGIGIILLIEVRKQ